MICYLLALRPILHITQKILSYLNSTKIEQVTKTMVIIFKNRRHFSLLHLLRSNTTTNFRPAARAYSQRYHLLLSSSRRIPRFIVLFSSGYRWLFFVASLWTCVVVASFYKSSGRGSFFRRLRYVLDIGKSTSQTQDGRHKLKGQKKEIACLSLVCSFHCPAT